MSLPSNVRFIRKDGRIIPIAAAGAATGVGVAHSAKVASGISKIARGANAAVQTRIKKNPAPPFKVNRGLDAAGLGLSVLSGAVAAATFGHGPKGLAAGFIASHAIDAAGIGANVASVAGHGHGKERAKLAAKNEARNFIVGNGVYAAGLVGFKKNRQAIASYASKIVNFAKKALRVAEVVE